MADDRLMTVQLRVKEVFESMNATSGGRAVTYHYASWAQFNVLLKNLSGPSVLHVLPPSGTLRYDRQRVKDRPELVLAFVDLTEGDAGGEENDQIVERMKRLAVAFVDALDDSGFFGTAPEELEYQIPYDTTDENVTGIVLTIPLEETDGLCSCCGMSARRRRGDGEETAENGE